MKRKGEIQMVTLAIAGAAFKIASVCGLGIGADSLMRFFHSYEMKFNKKGDKNAELKGESLRERAKDLY